MATLVFANVVARHVFSYSIIWMEEITQYEMIGITYLGAGLAMREGRHVADRSSARSSAWPRSPSSSPWRCPPVIDNANATYWISVGSGAGTLFDSVRVHDHLQVSPAPATATFGDVPISHPFSPYIEALVASGIPAGCAGGSYRPDPPLTGARWRCS